MRKLHRDHRQLHASSRLRLKRQDITTVLARQHAFPPFQIQIQTIALAHQLQPIISLQDKGMAFE